MKLALFAVVVVVVTAGACEPPPCIVNGQAHPAHDTFPAPDGCNTCTCGEDGRVACTLLACAGEGEGEGEGEGPDGEGEGEGDDNVTPIPAVDCAADAVLPGAGSVDVSLSTATLFGAPNDAAVWSIARAPSHSHAFLTASTGAVSVAHLDAFGIYVISLGRSASSTSPPLQCALRHVPSQEFAVELLWDSPNGDLDVHMAKADAQQRFCIADTAGTAPSTPLTNCDDQLDCNFATCNALGQKSVDWDGDGASLGPADPALVVDDLQGYGPEQIVVPSLASGEYAVAVNAYPGAEASGTTVNAVARAWLGGQLAAAIDLPLVFGDVKPAFHVVKNVDGSVCVDDFSGSAPFCATFPECNVIDSCAQCGNDTECGPNTRCDVQAALCVADDALCTTDVDCSNAKCLAATDVCTPQACVDDASCDAVQNTAPGSLRCDVDTGTCFAPPPSVIACGADEPDDQPSAPLVVTAPSTTNASLCQGDLDFFSIDVPANARLRAVVAPVDLPSNFIPSKFVDTSGDVLGGFVGNTGVFTTTTARTVLVEVGPGEAGVSLDYTVEVETQPIADPACANEPGEPDDDIAHAQSITGAGPVNARMCSDGVDVFHVSGLPSGVAAVVSVTPTTSTTFSLQTSFADANNAPIDVSLGSDGATIIDRNDFYVVVTGNGSFGFDYVLKVASGCTGDSGEPDGDISQARSIDASSASSATPASVLCGGDDVDTYVVALAAGESATLAVNGAGTAGNGSFVALAVTPLVANAGAPVAIVDTIPASPRATTWIVRATDALGPADAGGAYAFDVTTTTVTTCITGEHESDDDPTLAPCLGDAATANPCTTVLPSPLIAPALSSCDADPSQAGCGTQCGVDVDFIRLGTLAPGTVVHATLDHDARTPLTAPTVSLEAVVGGGTIALVRSNENGVLQATVPGPPLVQGELVLAVRGGVVGIDDVTWALSASVQ